ncbi:putative NBD/HSP70 family sugar kinase [Kibdelosporangium banguiense]|uniref:NBD/HSP70 family sugar kinase n=1 Tax=Kibdelosporangium banguiense TaxID=1365924 RepID=A0ABS4TSW2_9PSEU|nr:ROK family transcriptional regulator [Kibdelosporangium banguiense]MBP2326996.1 putative NBD/HSP70 family sugar kinase [Kibdelosporangium banguiense]
MASVSPSPRGDLVPAGILGLLGTQGPTARADIARSLGLSPATITQVIKDMLARGLVEELASVPSRGGRPARLLGLVARTGAAIGAKVTADHVALVTVELDGSVRTSTVHPFDPRDPASVGDILATVLDDSVLGVGVGVPGSVDAQASGIVDAPTLGWHDMKLGQRLRDRLGVPVLVDNDVNTLAAAERLYGVGREHSSYLVVTIGRGVGCGIVIDGAIYRGAAGGAGEIGHIPLTDDGPRCGCGAVGCLEAYIGSTGLLSAARASGVVGPRGRLSTLLKAARDGDQAAREVYAQAGRLLGRTLAGVVHTVDPEVVVLMGEGVDAWEFWQPGFEATLRKRLLPARRELPVVVEPWSEDQWARGAASLVLVSPFDSAGTGGEQSRMVRDRLGSPSGGA